MSPRKFWFVSVENDGAVYSTLYVEPAKEKGPAEGVNKIVCPVSNVRNPSWK